MPANLHAKHQVAHRIFHIVNLLVCKYLPGASKTSKNRPSETNRCFGIRTGFFKTDIYICRFCIDSPPVPSLELFVAVEAHLNAQQPECTARVSGETRVVSTAN